MMTLKRVVITVSEEKKKERDDYISGLSKVLIFLLLLSRMTDRLR